MEKYLIQLSEIIDLFKYQYRLTNAQTEVLGYILLGMTNEEIAKQMGIQVETVKNHASMVFAKTGYYGKTGRSRLIGVVLKRVLDSIT